VLPFSSQIYENMVEDEVVADQVLWCHFITAAARDNNVRLAANFYSQMLSEGMAPTLPIINALLNATGATGDLASTQKLYHEEVLGRGFQPDTYTAVALITAAARGNASLSAIDAIWHQLRNRGVRLNEFVGTALLTAYRTPLKTCPTALPPPTPPSEDLHGAEVHNPHLQDVEGKLAGSVGESAAVSRAGGKGTPTAEARGAGASNPQQVLRTGLLQRGRTVMAHLRSQKMANANAYVAMMALAIVAEQPTEATQLLREAESLGVTFEPVAFQLLARICEEYGLPAAAGKLWQRAEDLDASLQQKLGGGDVRR